ncbi:NAD(P)H-dependent oxidoreductase [Paenibacillus arenilitoris]|uniref:NAD(P)H-dependent oxidoreductase n=1 Tax=Paenibacillus arenilitoris TaxID=2772299 RepID=A0A927CIT6_9BACL|nr:NAD(P)H-dependent oxidoreductase [Paenibacillus arenilitoris]MBD2867867.1 NAD(P)H-dependent oxidoreductase [Paenibacillus arenilitoris]
MTTKEEILQAFRFRHACKEFDGGKKISEEDFGFILETWRLSPTSFGFEPGKLLILQNAELRQKLLPVTWGARRTLPTASHFVIILAREAQALAPDSGHIAHMMNDIQQLPEEVGQGKKAMYRKFLEHDFRIADNEEAVFGWAARQTYIALGNMMTAAAQIGIDSCPIEGFEKAAVESLLTEEGVLNDAEFGVACMVAFGYRIKEPREKTRQPLEQSVAWVD